MGVDTKAIIRKGTTIEQIHSAISAKYKDVTVRATRADFMYIYFMDGKDDRSLSVLFDNSCERENNIAGVWLSLGCWGNSVEIMRYLCESFGGYIKPNDYQEFYPINYPLYAQGTEFTPLDEFRDKVIKEVGFDRLRVVMSLLDEYYALKNNTNLTVNVCYKTNETCKYNCSGLCKESC